MRRALLAGLLFAAACGEGPFAPAGSPPDLVFTFPTTPTPDGGAPKLTPCGDYDPTCTTISFGPPFGVPFPMELDPNASSGGLAVDGDGDLALVGRLSFESGFVANATDWSRGTVSRVDPIVRRETARYLTVACTPCGNSCCSNDDPDRFAARLANLAPPEHQPIQLADNFPSRTSIDFNGDLWIENRAPGGQASVTKIANDITGCIDRNHDGKITTSRDVNGDGLIQTDCNGDGRPDDLTSVKSTPCLKGKAQEFFGLDDECLLFTVNLGPPGAEGRALALGPGANDFGPSDAWAGTTADATLYRIDGTTGITKDRTILPMECHPDGLAVDSESIAWSVAQGEGPLCWFATKKPGDQGLVRDPQTGRVDGRAISLDRDQNLWLADRTGARAFRYTPDRSAGTAKLGAGFWTRVTSAGSDAGAFGLGAGMAVDSRSNNSYFSWLALDSGWVVRLPASKIPLAKMDQDFDAAHEPAVFLPGFTPIAVGVDRRQDLQLISRVPAASITIPVDLQGKITPPDLQSPAKPATLCPAGDRCLLKDNPASDPGSDAYTNFNAFGFAGHWNRPAFYSYVVHGCDAGPTRWIAIAWSADVPVGSLLGVKARSGSTPMPDQTWGSWTPDFALSPADLVTGHLLLPDDASYLQLEVDISRSDERVVPRLKSLRIAWECPGVLW